MDATVIRSMISCFWTKKRPREVRNRLIRRRSSSASAWRSWRLASSARVAALTMWEGPFVAVESGVFYRDVGRGEYVRRSGRASRRKPDASASDTSGLRLDARLQRLRSEERRVGKECRKRRERQHRYNREA